MMKYNRKKHRLLAEINVVPYIDVMLVLLIIFMMTAPLFSPEGVKVNLPEANAKALQNPEPKTIIVSVDQSGFYYLNISPNPSSPISADSLFSYVQNAINKNTKNAQKPDVYIKGDMQANYGKVVQAMVLVQGAGVSNVGLVTQEPTNVSK